MSKQAHKQTEQRHATMPLTRFSRAVLLAIVVFTALYRFNALGGSLGGFDNDHFVHFAYARQMLSGEQPLRDFLSVGLKGVPPSLTFEASAAAQRWLGANLRSEALLSVGALTIAAALTYVAAARIASIWLAVIVTLLTVFESPKLYNYPKVLVFAAAALLIHRYTRRPTVAHACALAALTSIAFLFRHDYAVYVGAGAVAVLALTSVSWKTRLTSLVVYSGLTLLLLAPSLWYVERHWGVAEYFKDSLEISQREAQHTTLRWPSFTRADEDGQPVSTLRLMGVEQNAVAWLYYVHWVLPGAMLLALLLSRRAPNLDGKRTTLVALSAMAMVALPFMLRGNVAARFGDVGPLVSVLLAGVAVAVLARRPGERRTLWTLRAAVLVGVLAVTTSAVRTIGDVRQELDTSGWSDSAEKVVEQANRRWHELADLPNAYWTEPPRKGSVQTIQYLNRCTAPSDRVLVMTYAPEIVGLSGRLFAAGLSRLIPEEFTSERHQRVSIERWKQQSVPIVLTEDDALYKSYPMEFSLVDAYVKANYEVAGRVEIDGGAMLRVWARRGAQPKGTFGSTGLPCFQ